MRPNRQHAVGQIVGPAKGPVPCPLCNGTEKIDDPKCHGTGTPPCNTCTTAAAKNKCSDCVEGKVPCKTCEGTGLKSELLHPT